MYPAEDLIWDNTNKALLFREDILTLHSLDEDALEALLERLEESEIDDYTDIRTLIGVEFDENTPWGQLDVGELKLLLFLALEMHEEAKEQVQAFLSYNNNTVERGLFYQAINAVLEITLEDELELDNYVPNLTRMFGENVMANVLGSVDGSVTFYGLTPTNTDLKGLDRHLKLIESYKKLHAHRAKHAAQ